MTPQTKLAPSRPTLRECVVILLRCALASIVMDSGLIPQPPGIEGPLSRIWPVPDRSTGVWMNLKRGIWKRALFVIHSFKKLSICAPPGPQTLSSVSALTGSFSLSLYPNGQRRILSLQKLCQVKGNFSVTATSINSSHFLATKY